MLSRRHKVSRAQFPKQTRNSFSFVSPFLSVTKAKGDETLPPKVSIVVSSKTIPTAVKRNLFKRRAYALLEKKIKRFPKGTLLIFFARKGIHTLSFKELGQIVSELLEKSFSKK